MMDEKLKDKIDDWFHEMPVDGWVELDSDGMLYVYLFACAIRERDFRPGDFVRVQIVRIEDIEKT